MLTLEYQYLKCSDRRSFSSLPWDIFLLFCLFPYNGVCFGRLKLSADDAIVSQKGTNGEGKFISYGLDHYFTCTLCSKFLRAKLQHRYTFACQSSMHKEVVYQGLSSQRTSWSNLTLDSLTKWSQCLALM